MRCFSVLSLGLFAVPFVAAEVHQVTVGSSSGALTFVPEAIGAMPGDSVVFTFQQKNHSVTQSSFNSPCSQKEGGFNSGFNPVPANQTGSFPTYTLPINDTQPIWVFCDQAANTPSSHCGQGMVFAVNCGPDGSQNSFTNFKNSALAIGQSLQSQASSSAAGGYGAPYGAPAATQSAAYGDSSAALPEASGTPSGSSSASAATHTVIVGGSASLTFNPPETQANVGDEVVFVFMSKNHTVTQSSFPSPCRKLSSTNSSATGFDSGFMPVANGTTNFPTYSITVNDTNPIWGYCRQTGHCGQGMVFAINPVDNGPKNFTVFKQSAITQNGTATSGAAPAATSSPSSAGRTITGASLGLGLVGAVFALLL